MNSVVVTYIAEAFSLQNILLLVAGTLVGIIIGALPGFTSTMGIAVLMPLTYVWNPQAALIFLGAIFCGGMYGGSISAILINTPGTAAAAATAMDGYAMAQDGRAHEALTEAAVASFWGGQLSAIVLLLFAPVLAKWAFSFGSQEKFLMAVFGLSIIASLSVKDMLKGLMMGCLGLLIKCIGMDPLLGMNRYTFGSHYLIGGIPLVPALIGLFSMSQVLLMVESGMKKADKGEIRKYQSKKIRFKDFFMYPLTYLRSAIIGIVIGFIPGSGGEIASYVSHNMGKMFCRGEEKMKFGHGAREGVACCEAANNGVTGGALIPTLTLGIPGNATMAILLGGMAVHGLTPGYSLFTEDAEIVYSFIISLFLANAVFVILGLCFAKYFAMITLTPKNVLSGAVVYLATIGSIAVRGNLTDAWVMLIFGIIGYLLKKFKFDVVPVVLGMVLGNMAEEALQQSLRLNRQSLTAVFGSFFHRPISLFILFLIVLTIVYPFYAERRYERKKQAAEAAGETLVEQELPEE